ncbi:hypothetical protein CC2G_009116 [Coprinopsis cinerea AmutBmut pab1-1]|nr:hypothetical protein CC2G_009116 [Coprinopsis cinerea AmutBmut pab1-1]
MRCAAPIYISGPDENRLTFSRTIDTSSPDADIDIRHQRKRLAAVRRIASIKSADERFDPPIRL